MARLYAISSCQVTRSAIQLPLLPLFCRSRFFCCFAACAWHVPGASAKAVQHEQGPQQEHPSTATHPRAILIHVSIPPRLLAALPSCTPSPCPHQPSVPLAPAPLSSRPRSSVASQTLCRLRTPSPPHMPPSFFHAHPNQYRHQHRQPVTVFTGATFFLLVTGTGTGFFKHSPPPNATPILSTVQFLRSRTSTGHPPALRLLARTWACP